MAHREQGRIVETTTEARSGVTGHHVRTVLAAGTLAAFVLLTIVFLHYFS
jgi:hypothetical protein